MENELLISQLKKRLKDARKTLAELKREYEGKQEFYSDYIEYVNALEGRLADLNK